MAFGERIKHARQHQNLTQETVATELHVTRQTISSWERGKSYPDIDSLIRLSDYYQLSLDTLLKKDPGLTDTLRKPVVLKSIQPIIKNLTIVDIIFVLALIFAHQLFMAKGLLYLMGIINILTLNKLNGFARALDNTTPYLAWTKRRSWGLLIAIGSAVMAIGLKFAHVAPLANDFTFLAASISIALVYAEITYFWQQRRAAQAGQLP
ncbi:helix-turn-helix domain-containing protein [Levilactobacillus fujinensis]|uniref:Helix-turn-helix domain-containing protein n=1 Tax=Levilactobacillus fujinensis TaxID=2486024 RepID=A0ABW1TJM5_9LACO|nr:helix-turn-helix transcriptional regulator [Levilactobacillus fujinensis]